MESDDLEKTLVRVDFFVGSMWGGRYSPSRFLSNSAQAVNNAVTFQKPNMSCVLCELCSVDSVLAYLKNPPL